MAHFTFFYCLFGQTNGTVTKHETKGQLNVAKSDCKCRHLRSANRQQLLVPRYRRSALGPRAFSVAGPRAWNALPDVLRDPTRSSDSFRSTLKTFLFAEH